MMLSPVELEYMRRHRGLLNPNCMLDALFPHIDALQARVVELEQAYLASALSKVMDGRQIDYAAMAEVGDIASGKAVDTVP